MWEIVNMDSLEIIALHPVIWTLVNIVSCMSK